MIIGAREGGTRSLEGSFYPPAFGERSKLDK